MKTTSIVIGTILLVQVGARQLSAATNYVLSIASANDYVSVPDNPTLNLVSNFTPRRARVYHHVARLYSSRAKNS